MMSNYKFQPKSKTFIEFRRGRGKDRKKRKLRNSIARSTLRVAKRGIREATIGAGLEGSFRVLSNKLNNNRIESPWDRPQNKISDKEALRRGLISGAIWGGGAGMGLAILDEYKNRGRYR